jgi:membrane protein DedA with SNARE-associated domain
MKALLDWVAALPEWALYAILWAAGTIENLIPPFPSDLVIAFGGFLLAQGANATMAGVFVAVWAGNVGGAMLVYALGRKYGAEKIEARIGGKHAASRDARLHKLFDRYGLPAIFVSRFVPGVRAIVPAFAGALKLSVVWVTVMVASASAIWYGLLTVIAFRVGSDWEQLRDTMSRYGKVAAIGGAILLAVGGAVWLIARKRAKH